MWLAAALTVSAHNVDDISMAPGGQGSRAPQSVREHSNNRAGRSQSTLQGPTDQTAANHSATGLVRATAGQTA